MHDTKLMKKALEVAQDAHKNQFDKSGKPYITHPLHLSKQMDDEYSVCVALMHDVVEDSSYTFEDLENLKFPKEIIEALRLLTHNKDEDYLDYIKRIKENPLARKVKIADLKHNSDLSRLNDVTEKDLERLKKYKQALAILEP